MLYRLDSLYAHQKQIRNIRFITHHDFVEKLSLENIEFNYDESWETVNIDFYNMRWYELSDTTIISKAILTADNGDAFVRDVMDQKNWNIDDLESNLENIGLTLVQKDVSTELYSLEITE